MTRFLFALVLTLVASASGLAQDMPLSQILIDGEGWKKVEKAGGTVRVSMPPHSAHSPDRTTLYRWQAKSGAFIEARQNATQQPYAPYCPLRTKGSEKSIAVWGLTTDKDGRIYAATEIGVQVFDPTGRMCGVLTPAAPGTPAGMAFEGDTLTLWIDHTKYARKLRTEGVK